MTEWVYDGPFSWVPDREFPLGRRGDRPVRVNIDAKTAEDCGLLNVPGYVQTKYGYGRCTWDIVPVACKLLGIRCIRLPIEPWVAKRLSSLLGYEVEGLTDEELTEETMRLPGIAEYCAGKLSEKVSRDYQKEDAVFCARRAFAFNCIAMRGGKTCVNVGAAVLTGAKKVLVIGIGRTRRGWMRETQRVMGDVAGEQNVEMLALYGRRGNVARQWCSKCKGTGRLEDETTCPRCRKANGHADGMRLFNVLEGKCREHGWKGEKKQECPGCLAEFFAALDQARWVYVNYDLIIGQKETDFAGKERFSQVLQGQVKTLQRYKFDMVIVSESHLVSVWSSKPSDNRGKSKREKVIELTPPPNIPDELRKAGVLHGVERVICETGTPGANDISNYWAQWDIMTAGANSCTDSRPGKRMPFKYHESYCQGHKGTYGWEWGEQSAEAEWQLPLRHAMFMTERTYKEIFPHLPPETWELVTIEAEDAATKFDEVSIAELEELRDEPKYDSKLARLSLAAFEAKKHAMVDMVMEDMFAGVKVIVYANYKTPARRFLNALKREMDKKGNRAKLRRAQVWYCDGEIRDDIRDSLAEGFTRHDGPGVYVATFKSTNMGITLGGATHVIIGEYSFEPWVVAQAVRRSYMPPLEKLHITCFKTEGSIDEHVSDKLMKKYAELSKHQQGTDFGMIEAMGLKVIDKAALLTDLSALAFRGDPILGWSDDDD